MEKCNTLEAGQYSIFNAVLLMLEYHLSGLEVMDDEGAEACSAEELTKI